MQNKFLTLMTTVQDIKQKTTTRFDRVRLPITQLWMTAVLLGFLVIRIFGSNSVQRLLSWLRAR